MGVRVGSAGRQAWFWPLRDFGPAAALNGRQRFCTSEGIRPVRLLEINISAVVYRAMWGYGVDPSSDINQPATPPASGPGARLSASPVRGSNALVTLILDLWSSSVPDRQVDPGSAEGRRQVHQPTAGPHRPRPAALLAGRAGPPGRAPAPRTRGGKNARAGETLITAVLPWIAGSARQKRSGGPRVRPGRCPLYVRAQLETAGLAWTQRDFARPKATARKTRKTQLTGYFRR
jgi:hypothetical protein